MAHYVFQRNNGFGDFDYIRSFETMEITDYPELAAQVDDKYIGYIDMRYLNSLGFYAIGITALALRIMPHLQFVPVMRDFRPRVAPRPPRPHVPGAAPRMPAPRAGASRKPAAPRSAVVAPRQPVAPKPPRPKTTRTTRSRGPVGPAGMIGDIIDDLVGLHKATKKPGPGGHR